MKPLELNKNHAIVSNRKFFSERNGNHGLTSIYISNEELGKDAIKHAFYFKEPKPGFSKKNKLKLAEIKRDLTKLDKSLSDIYKKHKT